MEIIVKPFRLIKISGMTYCCYKLGFVHAKSVELDIYSILLFTLVNTQNNQMISTYNKSCIACYTTFYCHNFFLNIGMERIVFLFDNISNM